MSSGEGRMRKRRRAAAAIRRRTEVGTVMRLEEEIAMGSGRRRSIYARMQADLKRFISE